MDIALLGIDGAGKSTVARRLKERLPYQVKCIYMGWWIGSSNVTLPFSKLIHRLRGKGEKQPNSAPTEKPLRVRSSFFYLARLLYNLTEEWYRQLVSWIYQSMGYLVLYDRHFSFEYVLRYPKIQEKYWKFPQRVHMWVLENVYPKPDLVVFLDVPPEVAKARKDEDPLDYLEWQRRELIEHGRRFEQFIVIDGLKPLDEVCEEIVRHVERRAEGKRLLLKRS